MNADDTSLDAAFDKSLQRAFSPVLIKLFKALLEPTPSFAAITEHLTMDPMLSGTVLHLANTSAARGYGQKVTDVQRAAMILGTETLYRLVISLILQKQLRPLAPREPEHLFADWRITLWGASAADVLAQKLCPERRQAAYLAALLRDLPLLLAFCRQEVPDFIKRRDVVVPSSPVTFAEEESAWGRAHQELSHDIMTVWGMPQDMAEAVRSHHDYAAAAAAPPLSRAVIYATRWAEAVQAPESDPAAAISFEMNLAAELGLNRQEMETLRSDCSHRFTTMLGLLGIQEGPPENRSYEHSIDMLQTLHFLALEICSEQSLRGVVESLGSKLLSFWSLDAWELALTIPGFPPRLYTCRNGNIQTEETIDPLAELPAAKREVFALTASGRRFGKLCVPSREIRGESLASLSLFLPVLAMNFERVRRLKAKAGASRQYVGPPNFARLDAAGKLLEAGETFLSFFGLETLPENPSAEGLILHRFGLALPDWGAVISGELPEKVWLIPDGKTGGDGHGPLVLSLRPVLGRPDEFALAAETLPGISPVQAVSLACPSFLDILAANFSVQAFLLNATGDIFWTCPTDHPLLSHNIFTETIPGPEMRGHWTPHFLAGISEPIDLEVRWAEYPDASTPVCLRFIPLPGCGNACRLLCINP